MKYSQKSFQVAVQPTGVTQDEWDSIFKKKKPNSLRGSSFACEHANEVPAQCDCESDCYCATNTCAPKDAPKHSRSKGYGVQCATPDEECGCEAGLEEEAFEEWFKHLGCNELVIPTRLGLARRAFAAGRKSVK